MKIGEMARRTGCNIETIRYYERIAMIAPPPRKGRYRDYGPPDVERLRFIRRGRQLGFSLDEIRNLLSLAPRQASQCDTVQDIAERQLRSVRGKILDLRKMEKALASLVDRCDRNQGDCCPVVQSLSAGDSRRLSISELS